MRKIDESYFTYSKSILNLCQRILMELITDLGVAEFIRTCYDVAMTRRRKPATPKTIRRQMLAWAGQTLFSLTILSLLILAGVVGYRLFIGPPNEPPVIPIAPPEISPEVPAVATVDRSRFGPAEGPLVGIVSGHRGFDPGAVCEDGLSEVDVNYAIAVEVIDLLVRRGVQADLLDEYDPLLTSYQADALVSIHADSCNVPGASGFKVARVTDSAIPEAEDQLVACLYEQYETHTGLPRHTSSITDGMTNYHAFSEIAPLTPGAIIETGFLLDDRNLLVDRPKIVARGIAAGIVCFLENRSS